MRKTNSLIAATGLILIVAGTIGSAEAAKITLGMCIRSNDACRLKCQVNTPLPPPFRWSSCINGCIDKHAACVDKAMEFSAETSPPGGGPNRPPPTNILGDSQGFSTQMPSATGTPGGTVAPRGPALR